MKVLFRLKNINFEVKIPIAYIIQFIKENSIKLEHD